MIILMKSQKRQAAESFSEFWPVCVSIGPVIYVNGFACHVLSETDSYHR